jgi:hypothetical protein
VIVKKTRKAWFTVMHGMTVADVTAGNVFYDVVKKVVTSVRLD